MTIARTGLLGLVLAATGGALLFLAFSAFGMRDGSLRADSASADPVSDPGVIAKAASTRCLVKRLEHHGSELIDVSVTRSPLVVRAAALAIAAVPRSAGDTRGTDIDAKTLALLVELGDLSGAREIRARRGAGSKLPPEVEKLVALRLGDDVPEYQLTLSDVPILVATGDRARAERLLEAARPSAILRPTDALGLGAALGALGQIADLQHRIAAAESRVGAAIAVGWLHGAEVVGDGIEAAVAAVIAAERVPDLDDLLIEFLLDDATLHGHGRETAPLRVALVEAPSLRGLSLERLHRVALRAGADDAELDALEAAVDARPVFAELAVMRTRRAVMRGSLDEALAAAIAADDPRERTVALANLWSRHVSDGFDAAFERKLAAAACKRGRWE